MANNHAQFLYCITFLCLKTRIPIVIPQVGTGNPILNNHDLCGLLSKLNRAALSLVCQIIIGLNVICCSTAIVLMYFHVYLAF